MSKRFNPYRRYNGIYIPDGIYNQTKLSACTKLLYGRLLRYAGKDGVAYPKQETLAKELGITRQAIYNSINQLISSQLIEVDKGDTLKHEPNSYHFLEHDCLGKIDDDSEYRDKNVTPGCKDSLHPQGKDSLHPGCKDSLHRLKDKESHLKESHIREGDFDTFWESYPRKKSKENARKAWKKLKAEEKEEAIRVVKIYPFRDDLNFVQHPATWLNGKCWEDDLTPIPVAIPKHMRYQQPQTTYTEAGHDGSFVAPVEKPDHKPATAEEIAKAIREF